ncbi:hypothetical protein [Streptomyces chattanoogensis]|uniref:hypothetical protein n=1 Tax=Streptomyces chattanoogensis TaxID=66876 RepID=UPI0005D872E1|nr:hypothetical protein T261_2138 [Streptomyces lydicus]
MNRSPHRPRRTVPTQLAALALDVPPATVRKWASRGRLTRYGTQARAEYDLDELFALHDKRQAAAAPSPQQPTSS